MNSIPDILQRIKSTVKELEPKASVILYGSYARGGNNTESDIDLLILVDKDKITWQTEKDISYPLYDIELETGILISPMIYPRKAWEEHMVNPFYENVKREGKLL